MNEEMREYIEEVVKVLEHRFKTRTNQSRYSAGFGGMKRQWEQRLLDRAKAVLKANLREHA